MKKIVGIILTIVMVMSLGLSIVACQSECDKNGHTWDNGTITTPATCTTKGVKTLKCTVCDEETTQEIDMVAHTPVADTDKNKAPTCAVAGWEKATKCSVCGTAIAAGNTVPATGAHVDADEDGKCDVCKTDMGTTTPDDPCKDGHTWDAGVVTTPATCQTTGVKTFTCEVCEDTTTETLPIVDHEIDEDTGVCTWCEKALVTIDETQVALSIDNTTVTLTATASNDATITWTSSNAAIVSVANGVLTAKKPGTVTITASVENGIDATCTVTVANAYYIIGGQDSGWSKAASFGLANVPYFYATETEGIYKTQSIELGKKAEFQVALVGRTDNNWWEDAFNKTFNSTDAANVLGTIGDSNFQVEKKGKYTITLDLTGATPVVSGVLDEDLSDPDASDVDMYYLLGAGSDLHNWTPVTTNEAAGDSLFAYNEETETYTLTIKLTKGTEFKVAIVGLGWSGALGESALPRNMLIAAGTGTASGTQLEWTSSDNIGVGVTGWYTFTIDPDGGTNNVLTYEFSATDPALDVE